MDSVRSALMSVADLLGLDARTLRAIWVGGLYFGTFIAIGWGSRRLLDRWMAGKGMSTGGSSPASGERPARRFLLGAWYRDG